MYACVCVCVCVCEHLYLVIWLFVRYKSIKQKPFSFLLNDNQHKWWMNYWKLEIGWQALFLISIIRFWASQSSVLLCHPFWQLPDFPDVYWIEGKSLRYQARDLELFCLITMLLLDATLGSPNLHINKCIILWFNNGEISIYLLYLWFLTVVFCAILLLYLLVISS